MDDLAHRYLSLEGDEVRLVPLANCHASAIVAVLDDAMWQGFLSPRPSNVRDAANYVRAAHADRLRLPFAVEDSQTSEFRGSTSFYELDSQQGRVEIGHTFYGRRWWGGSTNPWCKLLMLEHAFDVLGLHRVALRCDARNARSASAIERLGARREGVLRGHRLAADGVRSDTRVFSILAPEWPGVRARLTQRLAVARVTRLGGPTALIDIAGARFVTDPTFDPPGRYIVGDRVLTKTAVSSRPAEAVGPVDAVLLSHDQHPDNLDRAGRAVLSQAPLILTTPVAARRLGGNAVGLAPWESKKVPAVDGAVSMRVTAVPAQHGPDGTTHITGDVAGFVIQADAGPTVYISGDNASLAAVEQIARRFPAVDIAVLHGGAARTSLLGAANLTLDADGLVAAARLLQPRRVVPVHVDSWDHLTETRADVEIAFAAAGLASLL
jgi:RimJ/RimL family protein N-acetyltransferase/L-ascorbate metabolism protein UlaG (beta-lactamase superfamily)